MKRLTEDTVKKYFEKLNDIHSDIHGLYTIDYDWISYILFVPEENINGKPVYLKDCFINNLKEEIGKMMFLNDYKYFSSISITRHYL